MNSNRRGLAATAIATAALTALAFAPAAGAAKSYKFKLDISIKQSVSWVSGWKSQVLCGPSFRHVAKGEGSGGFTVTGKKLPVTFVTKRGYMTTRDFAIPNHSTRRNPVYTQSTEGDPGDNCSPDYATPPPIDTSTCGTKKYTSRSKRWALLVVGGRLAPFGSIDDRYGVKCPDETSWSVVSQGKASRQRKDVDRLLKSPTVRSIELSASKAASGDVTEPDITVNEMGLPGDEDTRTGAGFGSYKWSVKLTRVR